MGEKLRVGMVCAAGIGASHVIDWRYLEDKAQIAAVMDVDPELAENTARMSGGVPWTTDLDEMLARKDVDAVDICSPPFAHADQIVKAAADHGCFLEVNGHPDRLDLVPADRRSGFGLPSDG